MSKFLDENGLLYLWSKIKSAFVSKESGKGLSTNDYTTAEKNKLAGIDTGANKTTVENVLTSTSTTNALSAAQGKVLDEKIKAINTNMEDLGAGDMLKSVYDTNGNGKVDDADKLGGQAPSYYATASALSIGLEGKVSTETGKGLSTNDYTTTEKQKLAGIAENANNYTHPTHTAKTSGLYKVTVDAQGHVSAATAVAKADITGLGIPAQDTTYNEATTSAAGLMSAGDKTKLNGVATGAQENVIEVIKVNGAAVSINSREKVASISVPTTVAQLTDAGNYALKSDLTNVYKYQGSVATYSDLPSSSTAGYVYNVESDGMNYAWNGTAWDNLGAIFTITAISNSEIDTIVAS